MWARASLVRPWIYGYFLQCIASESEPATEIQCHDGMFYSRGISTTITPPTNVPITNDFGGPARAIGRVCVAVCIYLSRENKSLANDSGVA